MVSRWRRERLKEVINDAAYMLNMPLTNVTALFTYKAELIMEGYSATL